MTDTATADTPTPDGRFTYRAAGDPDAPPIVFLHGIGGGASLWARQLASFGADHRAVAWNLPGYGGSPAPAASSIDGYAAALRDFLAALGLEHPVLVGHSIGGMILQAFVADGMGDPAAIVLAQTTPAFGGRDPAWAENFCAERLGPLDRGETPASLAPGAVGALIGPGGIGAADRAVAETAFAGVPAAVYRASVTALVGFDRRADLGGIAVPTLCLAGSDDANAPAGSVKKMAERIPGAVYRCLDRVGHLAFLEAPDAFDAAIRDFIAGDVVRMRSRVCGADNTSVGHGPC